MNKHIVFAWELGGGYGHVAGFTSFAQALIFEGFTVTVIAKNIASASKCLGHLDLDILQAPSYGNKQIDGSVTYTYPEIIAQLGYADKRELLPLVKAWCKLFEFLSPDLLLADHSPTALLAAKLMGCKTAMIGTGFFSPPRITPMPCFVGIPLPNKTRVLASESKVLQVINQVCQSFKVAPFTHLYELFEVDIDFLCTIKELDHYPERSPAKYWAPRFDVDGGETFTWPVTDAAKVFAYIKEDSAGFKAMLSAIARCHYSVCIHVPRASKALIEACKTKPHIHLLIEPANIAQVHQEADLVICHAGHGLVSASLLAGKRMLLIPEQLEQSMLTFLLANQRLVAAVNPKNKNVDFAKAMAFALSSNEIAENVKKFEQKYASHNQHNQIMSMVEACVSLFD